MEGQVLPYNLSTAYAIGSLATSYHTGSFSELLGYQTQGLGGLDHKWRKQ